MHNSNDHKSLRETCWALRDIIVPDLFKKLSISFLQDPSLTQSQLGALADVEGISNAAAAQYTQTLSISLCPPGFKRRLQTDPETAVYLGKAHERDATTAAIMQSLEPAISALKMLRRVEIYINYDGLEEIPQCMLSAISGALEQLPLLCDHELAYCNTIRPTILLSPLSLARLKRLSVSSNNDRSTTQEHEPIDVRGEQYPGWVHLFEHAVSGAISHSHSLEELELDTSEMSIERDASVSGFFSGITGPVLKIHTLTIRTWWIDLAAVTLLIPHTRHLKRLNICGQEYIHGDNSGLDALFQALGASGVALHSLDISAMSKAIPEFLCSFSGLQRLVIRPNITLSRKQPEGWAQGGAERFQLADLSPAIIAQSATLNYLNLGTRLASFWAYNSDVSKAIRACKELTTLVVTSTGGSTVVRETHHS